MFRVADWVFDYLSAHGVENFFTLPGGGAMHLVDALAKNPKTRAIPFFHEQGATIAAEASARVNSARLGVCVVTTGPGATNALTAVAGAWIESIPLLVISGQVKTSDLIGDRKIRQGGVQEVSIVDMVQPITKFAKTIHELADVKATLEDAVFIARSGRPGPVWVDIPLDIQGAQFNDSTAIVASSVQPPPTLDDEQLRFVARRLRDAQRPLLLLGHGVKISNAEVLAKQLIDRVGIPTVMTWNACDILPYQHPMNFGRPGVVAQRHPNFIVQKCDLLLSIGASIDNVTTAYNPDNFAPQATKIVVDIDSNQLSETRIDASEKIVADAGSFIEQLNKILTDEICAVARHNSRCWLDDCKQLKNRFENDFPVTIDGSTTRISHKDAVLALSDALPPDIRIATGSSGLAIEAFYTMFRNKPGQKFFLTSGLGSMGYGLPSAIGLAVELGNEPVVLVESDGSFHMNVQELQTVVNLGLKLCIVLLNNNGYASIRNTQKNYFSSRYVGTGPEAGQHMPDIKGIANAYGIDYVDVNEVADISKAISQYFNNPQTLIANINLVENEVLAPKSSAIPQDNGSIISMPLEDMSPLLDLKTLTEIMEGKISDMSKKARNCK